MGNNSKMWFKMTTFGNEMTNTQNTYQKSKLTKWLLTITLFFSVFTFSGYVGSYQSIKHQAIQTERLISNKYKTCKRTISYKKAFDFTSCNNILLSTYKNWANTLFTYNTLTKVKFESISRQFYSHKFIGHFLQVKTIPKSSDEDVFVAFIG